MNKSNAFVSIILVLGIVFLFSTAPPTLAQQPGEEEIKKTLRQAVGFYRTKVATEGGYLWKYSSDLSLREGENVADDQTVWVQPPGTPTIGLAFLRAWQITGDHYYLEAASDAGTCLVRGQLESGGWTYPIYFDAERRKKQQYRTDGAHSSKARNISSLDDNTTQSAILFLMELDAALDFKNESIHEAAQYALEKLLEARFPNGGFPQVFQGEKRNPSLFPVKPAQYPPEGTEATREKDYWKFYTFNDGLAQDVNRVFFAASEIYGTKTGNETVPDEKYVRAAEQLGDFIILAQMPDPQPAWAQQYDFEMQPCWARKFEPAAVTGGESQGIINTLIELYWFTGEKKYLEPIPKAVDYLERSRLPSGQVARFYEMRTNKPLYMTKQYELTYADDDLPTHYSFVVKLGSWPVDRLTTMDEKTRMRYLDSFRKKYRNRLLPKPDDRDIVRVMRSLDSRGAWVTKGQLKSAPGDEKLPIIDNAVFVKNIDILLGALARD